MRNAALNFELSATNALLRWLVNVDIPTFTEPIDQSVNDDISTFTNQAFSRRTKLSSEKPELLSAEGKVNTEISEFTKEGQMCRNCTVGENINKMKKGSA